MAIEAFKYIIIVVDSLKKISLPVIVLASIFLNQNIFYLILFITIFIFEYKPFKSYLIYVPLIVYCFKIFFSLSQSQYYWSKLSKATTLFLLTSRARYDNLNVIT